MKNLSQKIQIALLSLLMLGLVACSKSNFQSSQLAKSNTVKASSTSCQTQNFIVIYDEHKSGKEYSTKPFQERFQDFVSGTFAPSSLGDLSGENSTTAVNRVEMKFALKFGTDQNIVPAQTWLSISVVDSMVGTKDADGTLIDAYPVNFSKASSGQIDRDKKTFTVVFEDDYGSVTLAGTYDNSNASGRVDFVNKKSYSSSVPATSGVLGAFSIDSCGSL